MATGGERHKIHTLRDAIASFMEKSGLGRPTLSDQIGRAWCEILGPEVAKHTRLARTIVKGTLKVEVNSPTLLAELSTFRKPEILKGLQDRVKRKHIEDIRFTLGSGF